LGELTQEELDSPLFARYVVTAIQKSTLHYLCGRGVNVAADIKVFYDHPGHADIGGVYTKKRHHNERYEKLGEIGEVGGSRVRYQIKKGRINGGAKQWVIAGAVVVQNNTEWTSTGEVIPLFQCPCSENLPIPPPVGWDVCNEFHGEDPGPKIMYKTRMGGEASYIDLEEPGPTTDGSDSSATLEVEVSESEYGGEV
jgi:hypothetical protein